MANVYIVHVLVSAMVPCCNAELRPDGSWMVVCVVLASDIVKDSGRQPQGPRLQQSRISDLELGHQSLISFFKQIQRFIVSVV